MQETVNQQRQGLNYYPTLSTGNDTKLIQYDPIKELNQLFSLLSADDTSAAYQKAAGKTWLLFKKAIVLLLFVLCFTVALPIWLAGIGFQAGFRFHQWLDQEQPAIEQIVDRILQYLAFPFKQAFAWASWFMKQYFNWEFSFDHSAEKAPAPPKALSEDPAQQ